MEINKNNQSANIYWNERFTVGTDHHSSQNVYISQDFIKNISGVLNNLFFSSSTLIEIGCGTGELSFFLSQRYKNLNVVGTDLSEKAVEFANLNHKFHNLSYELFDCLNGKIDKKYDISICSNTLEHFTDPYYLIDKILELSNKLVILVPYNQPVTDGYDCEGGPGHVFHFKDDSFVKYKIDDWFTFSTPGWQHSSNGETPLQLCVCISKMDKEL